MMTAAELKQELAALHATNDRQAAEIKDLYRRCDQLVADLKVLKQQVERIKGDR